MGSGGGNQYQLYYNPFSICSIMVRMTLAMGRSDSDPNSFEEELVDIYTGEQMTEEYLKINRRGQVPALVSSALPDNLTDSLDITRYLCEIYPHLAPEESKQKVHELLDQLHQISYVSLSFTPTENRVGGIRDAIQKRLTQSRISDSYRKALEYKLEYIRGRSGVMKPEAISQAENDSRAFFVALDHFRAESGSTALSPTLYISDSQTHPTALDAHTITFIGRLFDAGRRNLVPDVWQQYGEKHFEGDAWTKVMDGKPTLHSLLEKGHGQ